MGPSKFWAILAAICSLAMGLVGCLQSIKELPKIAFLILLLMMAVSCSILHVGFRKPKFNMQPKDDPDKDPDPSTDPPKYKRIREDKENISFGAFKSFTLYSKTKSSVTKEPKDRVSWPDDPVGIGLVLEPCGIRPAAVALDQFSPDGHRTAAGSLMPDCANTFHSLEDRTVKDGTTGHKDHGKTTLYAIQHARQRVGHARQRVGVVLQSGFKTMGAAGRRMEPKLPTIRSTATPAMPPMGSNRLAPTGAVGLRYLLYRYGLSSPMGAAGRRTEPKLLITHSTVMPIMGLAAMARSMSSVVSGATGRFIVPGGFRNLSKGTLAFR